MQPYHVLLIMECGAKTHTGDIIDPHSSLNFRHSIHVFYAIIFAKVKSPFFGNSKDLCALCPVESMYGNLPAWQTFC